MGLRHRPVVLSVPLRHPEAMKGRSIALILAAAGGRALQARAPESAEAFLRRLYAPYVAGDANINPTGKAAPALFDARLTALIRQDQRNARDEVGALDGDPICDCQDFEPLKALSIAVQPSAAGPTTADVRFTNGARSVSLRYSLTLTRSGWRISDIGSPDQPSLAAYLEKANRDR